MKKIGILTFHSYKNRNYGAILQAYAVQKMIEERNYYSALLDIIPFKLNWRASFLSEIEGRAFKEFSNKYLRIEREIKDEKKLNRKFDAFVVGSDQVWRAKMEITKMKKFYFDFIDENKMKIAYAPSFGVDFWEGNEEFTKEIKSLVQRFNYVSVREVSGIKICNDVFGIDAECVLDPTMMVSLKDYQPILDDWEDKSHKKNKYIAHMLLDDTVELRDESNKIGNYLKSEINYIKGKDIKIFGKTITIYNKVSQWLTYLRDAELVITDSFHCTVFSILFKKSFVVVANPERGTARLENLLRIVGLKDRFFTDIKTVLKSKILDKTIDYNEVEKKLNVHREHSMNFLKKALGESNE